MNNHPFHLVDKSPWPITGSVGLMTTLTGMAMWFHTGYMNSMMIGYTIIIMTMIQWWRDVTRETSYQGLHSFKVVISMKVGMMMFILSEALFFLSFFWAFFHSSLAPSIEIGLKWPPLGIQGEMDKTGYHSFLIFFSKVCQENNAHFLSKPQVFISEMKNLIFTFLTQMKHFEKKFLQSFTDPVLSNYGWMKRDSDNVVMFSHLKCLKEIYFKKKKGYIVTLK